MIGKQITVNKICRVPIEQEDMFGLLQDFVASWLDITLLGCSAFSVFDDGRNDQVWLGNKLVADEKAIADVIRASYAMRYVHNSESGGYTVTKPQER